MSSPFAMSNFCALITGGNSAPSDGGEKITIVSFWTAWARASVAAPKPRVAATMSPVNRVKCVVMVFAPDSLDAEQLGSGPAIDGFNLIRLQTSVLDDRHRLVVADRKRHVRAEHDTVGAHHLDDKSKHARIVLDRVGVHQAQRLGRVGGAGRDRMVALETPNHQRQTSRGDRHKDLGIPVARDVTAHGDPRYGDDGVADPADAVGEAIIVDTALAGVEGRM